MIPTAPAEAVAACAAASAFCFALSFVPARNPLAVRLTRLEQLTERSTMRRLSRIDEIIGAERRSQLRDRLNNAGWYEVTPAAMVLRGIGGLTAGIAVALLLYFFLPLKPIGTVLGVPVKPIALLLGVFIVILAWRAPKIALDRAIAARRERIIRELPDFLDILAATVRAGLALSGALIHAAEVTTGPLRDELQATLSEIRLGRPRADALQAMANRINEPQTSIMVTSVVQAERLGANLATVLHELALDTRNRRWTLAEERAAQVPIKMIFPMGLLMLPALYVMIFTPVVARYFAHR
jgi:tight adherence protein C